MNGYTVQIYTFSDAIANARPMGLWLAQQHTLGVLLGAFTVLFELFFLGGILFHVGLYVASGHPFFFHILMNALLLFFLDPDWFERQVSRLQAPWRGSSRQPAHQPT